MPYINLIQEERLAALQVEKRARVFFGTFVGSLALVVCAFGYFFFRAASLADEESALRAQAAKAQPLISQIEENKKMQSELEPRVQTLQDAQAMTGKWGTVLEYLTTQTPPQTWLTSLRATVADASKPIGLTFAGLSDRQELVGDYILRLQSCKELENVQLRFTAEKPVAASRAIEFEIGSDLAGTAIKSRSAEEGEKEESK